MTTWMQLKIGKEMHLQVGFSKSLGSTHLEHTQGVGGRFGARRSAVATKEDCQLWQAIVGG